MPTLTPTRLDLLHGVRAEMEPGLSPGQLEGIEKMLRTLMPWRKGPFSLYGIDIDTEWHSDWKWDRVLPHISPLAGRTILDVGCGSGYHLWRMIGAGAHLAVGIDPMQLFLCQFEAVRKLLGGDQRAHLLPLGIEQLPELAAFDTVFSMGVLYHRRSPLDHLYQLKTSWWLKVNWCWKRWWWKAIATRCWCRAIVMRRCAMCISSLPPRR